MCSKPVVVVISGAAGQIGYAILPIIASGSVFGCKQEMSLRLLEIPQAENSLKGVVMELQDGAYPLVKDIVGTSDANVAFKDADYAFLVGGFPRKAGMERKELLAKNKAIFVVQGRAINEFAKKSIKVLVVANPANTNCLVAIKNAPSIDTRNFCAMTRLDHNRALGLIAKRTGSALKDVKNVIIWGNHSSTQFPDVAHGTVAGKPIAEVVNDEAWLYGDFLKTVQQRGAAIIAARGVSSAMSAANAATDHMRDWVHGTPAGKFVSMGVYSDGAYGAPKDIVYSFPCTCQDGQYRVVPVLSISPKARELMDLTAKELLEEKADAEL